MFNSAHVTPLERKAIAWLAAKQEAQSFATIKDDEFERAMGCNVDQLVERMLQIEAVQGFVGPSFGTLPEVVEIWRAILSADEERRKWWFDKIVFGAIVPFVVAGVTAFATAYFTVKLTLPPKP